MTKMVPLVAVVALSALGGQMCQAQKQIRPPGSRAYRPQNQTRLLERHLTILETRRRVLLQKFKPSNPKIRAIDSQIRDLRHLLSLRSQTKTPRHNIWRPELQLLTSH